MCIRWCGCRNCVNTPVSRPFSGNRKAIRRVVECAADRRVGCAVHGRKVARYDRVCREVSGNRSGRRQTVFFGPFKSRRAVWRRSVIRYRRVNYWFRKRCRPRCGPANNGRISRVRVPAPFSHGPPPPPPLAVYTTHSCRHHSHTYYYYRSNY